MRDHKGPGDGIQSDGEQTLAATELMTVAEVAAILNMSARYVRDHAREMGGIRIGGGRRRAGRLRFPLERVRQFVDRRSMQSTTL